MLQYFNSYFYNAPYTDMCDCTDFSKIWCFSCLNHLTTENKTLFSKNVSRHRNYAVILYIMTACVDFVCMLYYGGKASGLLIFSNFVLLVANGCCGILGTTYMNLILVMCNFTWVSIIMITHLGLLVLTFVVAED